jgi:hypothetical protein
MCRILRNPDNSDDMKTMLLGDLAFKHSSACADQNLERCRADFGDSETGGAIYFPKQVERSFLDEHATPLLDSSAGGILGAGILDRTTCDAVASASTAEKACRVVANRFLDETDLPNLVDNNMYIRCGSGGLEKPSDGVMKAMVRVGVWKNKKGHRDHHTCMEFGSGFFLQHAGDEPLVVTAAHCLWPAEHRPGLGEKVPTRKEDAPHVARGDYVILVGVVDVLPDGDLLPTTKWAYTAEIAGTSWDELDKMPDINDIKSIPDVGVLRITGRVDMADPWYNCCADGRYKNHDAKRGAPVQLNDRIAHDPKTASVYGARVGGTDVSHGVDGREEEYESLCEELKRKYSRLPLASNNDALDGKEIKLMGFPMFSPVDLGVTPYLHPELRTVVQIDRYGNVQTEHVEKANPKYTNEGSSGGPAVNKDDEVVGVLSWSWGGGVSSVLSSYASIEGVLESKTEFRAQRGDSMGGGAEGGAGGGAGGGGGGGP